MNQQTAEIRKLTKEKVKLSLTDVIINLVEEGYTEEAIRKYIKLETTESLIFLEEYFAL